MHQTSDKTRRARSLRGQLTRTEALFWDQVRGRRLHGLKFRRQTPVAGFVVDFACPERGLVIELDGSAHDGREVEDVARDKRLIEAGFTVLRFRNSTFTSNPNVVFEAIRQHMNKLKQPPHPSGSAAHLLPRGEKERS